MTKKKLQLHLYVYVEAAPLNYFRKHIFFKHILLLRQQKWDYAQDIKKTTLLYIVIS